MAPDPCRTVVICDDHSLIVDAVRRIVERLDAVSVVAVADNGLAAIASVKQHRPDLLILDLAMPHARGFDVMAEVARWAPQTRILVLTGIARADTLHTALEMGAVGLALKSEPLDRLAEGVGAVLDGETWQSDAVRDLVAPVDATGALTPRERQVLLLTVEGLSHAEIAERLSISPKTAENHRSRLMKKLGVHSAAQLIVHALKTGLLTDPSSG